MMPESNIALAAQVIRLHTHVVVACRSKHSPGIFVSWCICRIATPMSDLTSSTAQRQAAIFEQMIQSLSVMADAATMVGSEEAQVLVLELSDAVANLKAERRWSRYPSHLISKSLNAFHDSW